MRKVILGVSMSFDGRIARANGTENKSYSEGLVALKYERKREIAKPTKTKRTK